MINTFNKALFDELERRDVAAWNVETEIVHDPLQGKLLRGTFQPKPVQYYFMFKLLDDDWDEEGTLVIAAKRAAYQMENKLHPERIEKMLLEAAMEVINGDQEVEQKV